MIDLGIIKLLVSEKSSNALAQNKYTFIVDKMVNKIMMKQYLKQKYAVDALDVNSVNYKGKKRRRGRVTGMTKAFKKMIVTLKKGQEIKEYKEIF